jgi:Tfp pilus assembly protein PilV
MEGATLSDYLLEVAQKSATAQGRERIEQLRENVIETIASFDGSPNDLAAAIDALQTLAFAVNFAQSNKSITASVSRVDARNCLAKHRHHCWWNVSCRRRNPRLSQETLP